MTDMEKAKAFLKNLSLYQRIVVMNGVGTLYWTQNNDWRYKTIHIYLTLIPWIMAFGLFFRAALGDDQRGEIAFLTVAMLLPFFFLFQFSGRTIVRSNRFVMDYLSEFRKLYMNYIAVYYVIMFVLIGVEYSLLF